MSKKESKIRKAAVKGLFYNSNEKELTKTVESLMLKAKGIDYEKTDSKELKALLLPHAALQYSGITAAFGYKLLEEYLKKTKRIFSNIAVFGPSHYKAINYVAYDENEVWEFPLGNVKIKKINSSEFFTVVSDEEAHINEHSIEVQLPFLQYIYGKLNKKFELMPFAVGQTNYRLLAKDMENVMEKHNALIIISTDWSHYYDFESCIAIDKKNIEKFLQYDYNYLLEFLEACGYWQTIAFAYLAKKMKLKAILLDYRNSGHVSSNKESVVGYASIAFFK